MKSVTFSLVSWPAGQGVTYWYMSFGPALYKGIFDPSWLVAPGALVGSDMAVQLRDDDRYYRISWTALDVQIGGYISTSAFTFEDGAAYTFDAATNSLTKIEPAPVEGDWLDSLVSFWAGFSNKMAAWAADLSIRDWPFNILAPFVVVLSSIVDGIFGAFLDFRIFWRAFAEHVGELPLWDDILAGLKDVIDNITTVWAWFSTWATSVGDAITTWWDATYDTVKAWVETKIEGLPALLIAWDDFFTNTLPTLFDLAYAEEWWKGKIDDVGQLISSAFTERADLWAGWSDLRQGVSDFFADPLEWLWSRFTNWFLGRE